MAGIRMVALATVPNGFQARVLAARLGASGIPVTLRGPVDGPYPVGDVVVEVLEDDADVARQLLLADEVEAVFEARAEAGGASAPTAAWHVRRHVAPLIVAGAAVVAEAVALVGRYG